ncbi:MAG: sodium:solute symporter family protein [Deltaproteobacteria bacterium]|nr:sodium:solute symporter family protein [Deltaproteobacteria bacterium]
MIELTAGLVIYCVLLAVIGWLGGRKTQGFTGFTLADRKLGLIATTSTLAATSIGATATIVTAIYVYKKGLAGAWIDWSGAIGFLLLAVFLAHRVRKMGVITLPEIAGVFYGPVVRRIASFLVILAELAWLALLIQASQLIISSFAGVPPVYVTIGIALLFTAYTCWGGQRAVAWSDVLQLGVMFLGIVVVGAPMALKQAGGLAGFPDGFLSFPTSPSVSALNIFEMFILLGLSHLVGSDLYGKLLSARDERTARIASACAGAVKFVFGGAVILIALAAVKIMPGLPNPNAIFPQMILMILPSPLDGVLLLGMLAAMMSSADTVLLTAATTFCNDLAPGKSSGGQPGLREVRVVTLLFGLTGLLIALILQDVIAIMKLGYTIFAAGLIIPILAGFYRHRLPVTPLAGGLAMVLGGGCALVWRWAGQPWVNPVVMGTGASCAGLLLGLLLSRNKLAREKIHPADGTAQTE